MKKKIFFLCLIIIFILFACSKTGEKEVNTLKDKTLTMAQKSEIKTLDPQKATDSVSMSIIHLINENLVYIDSEGNLEMNIAEKINQPSKHETIITIKKNLSFSNGKPLTIDDVIFSLERAKNTPSKSKDFYMIENIEKINDNSLKIHTFFEAGNLLHKLSSTGAAIIHKQSFEENNEEIIGSGMFKLIEWLPGDKLILEKNKHYKTSNSNIEKLVVKFISEANSRAIMLETGEVDISKDLLPLDLKKISKDSKFKTVEIESPSNIFLGFDLRNPLLNNKKIRQAIAYAINNQDLVDVVFQGSASPATSPVPKNTTGHDSNVKNYEQNFEKAKELLSEAGYPNGFDIEIYVSEDNQRVDMAIIIQDNLKKIGINTEIKIFQWAAYISMIENPNIIKPIFLLSWNISNDDPEEVLYPMYHSSQIDANTNVVFYKNENFDKLILDARYTNDREKRLSLYNEAQNIIQEDLPHYTLIYPKQNFAYRREIQNIKYNKRGFFNFKDTIIK